jgi:hypothetical protein
MMTVRTFKAGDTLSSFAADVFNGDWERFPEIVALNPDFDPLKGITTGAEILLPEVDQIFNFANRELSQITSSISAASGVVQGLNIPFLSGYADKALSLVGEVNGAIGKAESVYRKIVAGGRDYKGIVNLVPWLLEGN